MYQYWQHNKSGDVWAVEIKGGKVVASTDELHHSEVEKNQPEDFSHNMSTENVDWLNENEEDFRLKE